MNLGPTSSSPTRRSLLGLVLAVAMTVACLAAATPANASSGSPIGVLDGAAGYNSSGLISGLGGRS
jgi:hypothetical protein